MDDRAVTHVVVGQRVGIFNEDTLGETQTVSGMQREKEREKKGE